MTLPALLDAIKARVAAIDLSAAGATPVIQRRYLPDTEAKALAALHVDVSPGTAEYDFADRSELEGQHLVQIGFRQSLPPNVNPSTEAGNAWIDARIALIASVVADLAGNDHDDEDDELGVSLNTVTNDPMYDVDTLRKNGVFLSIVNLTYSEIS